MAQVHKANTEGIPANSGILAGDFVYYMVLFREDPIETEVVLGIEEELHRTKERLTSIGQVLDDSKEQLFIPTKSVERLEENPA
eukprot:6242923-Heterocapsa_arctica.AAC.1